MRDTEAKYDRTATEMYLGLSSTTGASSSIASSSVTLHAHGHREKHKKYVIQNANKQLPIQTQMQTKGKEKTRGKNNNNKAVINVDLLSNSDKQPDNNEGESNENSDSSDESDEADDDDDVDDEQVVLDASAFHVIVVAHTETAAPQTDLLDEVRPGFIVLYDADMGVVRSIEVYNAQHNSRVQPLKVYLLMYGKLICDTNAHSIILLFRY